MTDETPENRGAKPAVLAEGESFVSAAHSVSSDVDFVQNIRVGHHSVTSDEPASLGGQDKGPAPFGLLLASLAACTAITLKMYSARKSWELGVVKVDLAMYRDAEKNERIERTIGIEKPLTDEQRTRLVEIAGKTPVTKTLLRSVKISTTIR